MAERGGYEALVVVETAVPASQLGQPADRRVAPPPVSQGAGAQGDWAGAQGAWPEESDAQPVYQSAGSPLWTGEFVEGEPRLLGLRIRRRVVWGFFSTVAALVLIFSCSGDGAIQSFDGVQYAHYSQVLASGQDYAPTNSVYDYPDASLRAGFQCTGGGSDAADSSIALVTISFVMTFFALAFGLFVACRGGCAVSGPFCGPLNSEPDSIVNWVHRLTAACCVIVLNLWLSRVGLLSEIRGSCLVDQSVTSYMYGIGAEALYAERGYAVLQLGWNGTAKAGTEAGALAPPGYFVSYGQTASLRDYSRGTPGKHAHLYGAAIGAAFIGALALLLQIPAILYSQRAIEAKARRAALWRQAAEQRNAAIMSMQQQIHFQGPMGMMAMGMQPMGNNGQMMYMPQPQPGGYGAPPFGQPQFAPQPQYAMAGQQQQQPYYVQQWTPPTQPGAGEAVGTPQPQ